QVRSGRCRRSARRPRPERRPRQAVRRRGGAGRRHAQRRRAADLGRDRGRLRRGGGGRRAARRGLAAGPLRRCHRGRRGDAAAAGIVIRSPFAYSPKRGPLQSASPGAAVAYLGSLVAVAFLYSSPIVLAAVGVAAVAAGLLAGARRAVLASLWMGLTLGLLIVVVNAIVVGSGETVVARLGEWPILGRVDVTAEAIAEGAVLALRAVVVLV